MANGTTSSDPTSRSVDTIIDLQILKLRWSPQQISGWLRYRQSKLPTISHERIYQHVWDDKLLGGTLYRKLRHSGNMYKSRSNRYPNGPRQQQRCLWLGEAAPPQAARRVEPGLTARPSGSPGFSHLATLFD